MDTLESYPEECFRYHLMFTAMGRRYAKNAEQWEINMWIHLFHDAGCP